MLGKLSHCFQSKSETLSYLIREQHKESKLPPEKDWLSSNNLYSSIKNPPLNSLMHQGKLVGIYKLNYLDKPLVSTLSYLSC